MGGLGGSVCEKDLVVEVRRLVQTGSGWPMVGRDDELRQALAALEDDAEFHGVALVGDSGVGKSTLARAVADSLESGGATVRHVLGTQNRLHGAVGRVIGR